MVPKVVALQLADTLVTIHRMVVAMGVEAETETETETEEQAVLEVDPVLPAKEADKESSSKIWSSEARRLHPRAGLVVRVAPLIWIWHKKNVFSPKLCSLPTRRKSNDWTLSRTRSDSVWMPTIDSSRRFRRKSLRFALHFSRQRPKRRSECGHETNHSERLTSLVWWIWLPESAMCSNVVRCRIGRLATSFSDTPSVFVL
mmetsp:Transcript_34914/g.87873  ORF Transcript_34914/g.87873 Transcript_34914/m.87873 type:complete len:201 (-) Transcript_34914:643-1245(-)